jgi:hypothetical protein
VVGQPHFLAARPTNGPFLTWPFPVAFYSLRDQHSYCGTVKFWEERGVLSLKIPQLISFSFISLAKLLFILSRAMDPFNALSTAAVLQRWREVREGGALQWARGVPKAENPYFRGASHRVPPSGQWPTGQLWHAPQDHNEQVEVLHQGFRWPRGGVRRPRSAWAILGKARTQSTHISTIPNTVVQVEVIVT